VTDETAPSRSRRTFWLTVRYAVGVGLGVFILVLLVGQRGEFTGALHHLDHLNYAWETGAVLAEVTSVVERRGSLLEVTHARLARQ
jgi:hypothetical protein